MIPPTSFARMISRSTDAEPDPFDALGNGLTAQLDAVAASPALQPIDALAVASSTIADYALALADDKHELVQTLAAALAADAARAGVAIEVRVLPRAAATVTTLHPALATVVGHA